MQTKYLLCNRRLKPITLDPASLNTGWINFSKIILSTLKVSAEKSIKKSNLNFETSRILELNFIFLSKLCLHIKEQPSWFFQIFSKLTPPLVERRISSLSIYSVFTVAMRKSTATLAHSQNISWFGLLYTLAGILTGIIIGG